MAFKSGFVAVIGRPNAGKSTLVNKLVGQKVAIVSPRPQTTRNRINGIFNRPDAQIVLVDTPGIHKPTSALNRQMMEQVESAMDGIDLLALMVDATEGPDPDERLALERVRRFDGASYLLLNKVDRMAKERLLPMIDGYQQKHAFSEIFPISALTGSGLPQLVESWIAKLPENPPYFPEDQFTDQPERFLAAEFVREKAIRVTREEVPHAIAVIVEQFEEKTTLVHVTATIYVEREGQKGILVGKGGATIKKIGMEARLELEKVLGVKIFLELFVKVHPNWRQKPAMVRQLDWHHQLERMSGE